MATRSAASAPTVGCVNGTAIYSAVISTTSSGISAHTGDVRSGGHDIASRPEAMRMALVLATADNVKKVTGAAVKSSQGALATIEA